MWKKKTFVKMALFVLKIFAFLWTKQQFCGFQLKVNMRDSVPGRRKAPVDGVAQIIINNKI